MSYFATSDFWLEVAKGKVDGHSLTIVRGHNPSQTSASGDVDISEFGDLTYLSAAETMSIVSTSTDDDGAPVGIGARTLLIQGVSGTGVAISETITLNGTTPVVTALSYLRVNAMIVLAVGTSGWNVGDITATASVAATIQDKMGAVESLSQSSHFTVPLAVTAYLLQVELNTAKISGGGNPEVEFKGLARVGGAGNAWLQLFDKKMDTAVTDELDVRLPAPTAIAARSDIRMRADTDTNNTECRTRMYICLVDD